MVALTFDELVAAALREDEAAQPADKPLFDPNYISLTREDTIAELERLQAAGACANLETITPDIVHQIALLKSLGYHLADVVKWASDGNLLAFANGSKVWAYGFPGSKHRQDPTLGRSQ